ncbi:hypothetical protein RJ035_004277, partial [Blastomyces gilchristii]
MRRSVFFVLTPGDGRGGRRGGRRGRRRGRECSCDRYEILRAWPNIVPNAAASFQEAENLTSLSAPLDL